MTPRTNFDRFLGEQLRDPDFAERFKAAGEAWNVALQIAGPHEEANSQKEHGDIVDLPNSSFILLPFLLP